MLSDEDEDNEEYSFASPIYDSSFTFNTMSSSDYFNKKNIVLCTNIFKKMGRGIKKGAKESGRFIKNNWKPIAIGSSALAVGAVIYVIASSKPSEPSFPTSLQKETIKTEKENNSTIQKDVPNQDSTTTLSSENKNPLLTQVLEDSVQTFKMDLQKDNSLNQQQTNPTLWQNTKGTIKEYSGYFAHTILDEVTDYAKFLSRYIEETVDIYEHIMPEELSIINLKKESEKTFTQTYEEEVFKAHQKIDQIFAINISDNYTKTVKEIREKDFSIGILPPPSGLLKNITKLPGIATKSSILNIIKPNGKWIGAEGSRSSIRLFKGRQNDAAQVFTELTKKGKIIHKDSEKIISQLSDEIYITYRPLSTSGPPTIDIKLPEMQNIIKLKFLE